MPELQQNELDDAIVDDSKLPERYRPEQHKELSLVVGVLSLLKQHGENVLGQ